MKKLLLSAVIVMTYNAYCQKINSFSPVFSSKLRSKVEANHHLPMVKNLNCIDTIRYPQAKEQILGTNAFNLFDIWQSDNESFSQAFLNTGAISISGIEFFGQRSTSGAASVTVQAAIYNVNASFVPTTMITSGSVTFTSTTAGYHYVSFAPVVVSGNYAIVLSVTNTGGIYSSYVNSAVPGQTYDENFAKFKSNYYPQSAGAFVSITTLTTGDAVNFASGPYNFEALVAPIVSYAINTNFTATPNPSCLGTPVTYSNTTTPAYVFTNRMLDYQKFKEYWMGGSDSTFVYEMNATTDVWQANHTFTYPTSGNFNPTLYTLGGFWNSCFDYKINPVVVNPLDDASFAYSGSTLCSGSGSETPVVTLTGGTFAATPAGLIINSSTGEIDLVASSDNTYNVSYTTNGACPNSSSNSITLNSIPDATFTYSQPSYCSNGSDPSPVYGTGASAGVFTSSPGLSINGANGMVDLSASTAGNYTVTNTIAASGSCPLVSETFDVEVIETPTASVMGGGSLCGPGTIPVSISLSGNGPWDVTYSDGTNTIVLNGQTTSPISIDASSNSTYTVSSVVSAGCSNTGTGSATATFHVNPTVTLNAFADMCNYNDALVLTGGVPVGGTYSGTGVSGGSFDPSTAGNGAHTITYEYVDMNNCSGSAMQVINVDACANLNELNEFDVIIAPNPASEVISVYHSGDLELTLTMLSEDGKMVQGERTINSGQTEFISIDNLAGGIYFLQFTSSKGKMVKKLFIQ